MRPAEVPVQRLQSDVMAMEGVRHGISYAFRMVDLLLTGALADTDDQKTIEALEKLKIQIKTLL